MKDLSYLVLLNMQRYINQMSKKPKKDRSKIRRFWNWLGKQNVFLVFAVFFLLIYGSTKAYAHLFVDTGLSGKSTSKPTVKITEAPQATPSPTIKNPNFGSVPFSFPSSKPTVSPTTDQDPIIDCKRPDDCGGGTIQVKRSECFNKVCCPVGGDKYETLTSEDCFEKRAEYLKQQNEEYLKKKDEEHKRALDEYKKLSDQYESELNQKLLDQQGINEAQQEEYENQIQWQYDICVSNARDKAYRECAARNTCDSYGYGSPTWIIQEETKKCQQLYY